MIRELSFKEVMQVEVIGDPLLPGDIKHARKGAREYLGSWIVVMLTKKGARLEVTAKGRGFRWRLNGYAQDGSDVGLASKPGEPPKKKERPHVGLWGLWNPAGFGGWATTPFENPLKDFMLFDSKADAEKYINEHYLAYGSHEARPYVR